MEGGKEKYIMDSRKILEQQRTEEKEVEKEAIQVIQTNEKLVRKVTERKRVERY